MQQEISDQQLMQMAQQEQNNLQSKQSFLENGLAIMRETTEAINALEELKKKPEKILVKLGSGIMIDAEPKNFETCKKNFAEGGYLEQKIDDTLKELKSKQEQIEKQINAIQKEMAMSESRLTEIVGILKQIDVEKRKAYQEQAKKISTPARN